MKISVLLKTAMMNREVKNAVELSELSGVTYGVVIRALNDENVGVLSIVSMLDCMGYKLKAVDK